MTDKYKANEQIPFLRESRWGGVLKKGNTFTILKEVGSFYKIKSEDIEDNTVMVSILQSNLDKAELMEAKAS